MKPPVDNFYFMFNECQVCDVYYYDVHPRTFERWAETSYGFYWGYNPEKEKGIYSGYFGELHFVKGVAQLDTVEHELEHLLMDWCKTRKMNMNANRNEERICQLRDELSREYWRAWGAHYKRKTIPIP